MSIHKPLTIGLFGFGVVGEGIYKVLQQTPSLKAQIKKVCIKNFSKKRNAPASLFTTDREELLNDRDINVIIEVIDDADAAFEIVSLALQNGKDVVSASKKMLAEHLPRLLELQEETGRSLLYEAAACASIPVIRNLEEYYDNDLLHSITAIINGSTNYILTQMTVGGLDFKQALALARQNGFAESNPALDVEGYDAANKWTVLLAHAYGIVQPASQLLFTGIQHIHATDTAVAAAKKQQIKLVARAQKLSNGKVAAYVLPQFVNEDDHLAFVRNEYNGVVIESSFADKQFFYGKGAGSFPTASAILSDLAALRYGYRYEYKKKYHHTPHETDNSVYLRVHLSFNQVEDVPREKFEWIEEWHAGKERSYLSGVIAVKQLLDSDWWKQNGLSLVAHPDAVIEETLTRQLQKRSLELAGVL